MKIAHVVPSYYPNIGGIETHVREIATRLVKRHEVEIITADLSGSLKKIETHNGVKITRFPSVIFKKTLFFSPAIQPYLRENQYDILHAHNYHAFPALFASKITQNNLVFNPHYHGRGSSLLTSILLKPYSLLGKNIFHQARKIICDSEYEQNLVLKDFNIDEKRISVIPSGISLDTISRAEPYQMDEPVVLYIGRIDKYKNIDLTVKMMKFLPEFKFYIIGRSGNYKQNISHLVRRLNLTDRIHILDAVSDEEKYRWLKSCSLFINLSDTEAFGISVLEALAAGKSVIVNNTGGLQEFVKKYGNEVMGIDIRQLKNEKGLMDFANLVKNRSGLEFRPDVSEYDWDTLIRKVEQEYIDVASK
jgi:glycosyltransferase involved in cell wall biosynthesis